MEPLLILTYTAICVAVFKIFRIPVNKWTVPTAALGGIFLITSILLQASLRQATPAPPGTKRTSMTPRDVR